MTDIDIDIDIHNIIDGQFPILLSADIIQARVTELAKQVSQDYHDKCPILIGVLNGAFIFMSDLVKQLTINCEVDFIKISSYGNAKKSSGTIDVLKEIDCHLAGRDVLVVEDIVDSGLSVNFLRQKIMTVNPGSLKFVSLLRKKGAAKIDFKIDYLGFWIADDFVVGYGLDFAQKFRNLPAVYVLK